MTESPAGIGDEEAKGKNPSPNPTPKNDIEANKDIAALSYIWILSVFVFFARRDSPFVRFHARQGMTIFFLSILVWMVPMVGRYLVLLLLALAVMGFLAAAQGQRKELLLIGPLSRFDRLGLRQSWREFTVVAVRIGKELSSLFHGMRRTKKNGPASGKTIVPPLPSAQPAVPPSPEHP